MLKKSSLFKVFKDHRIAQGYRLVKQLNTLHGLSNYNNNYTIIIFFSTKPSTIKTTSLPYFSKHHNHIYGIQQ